MTEYRTTSDRDRERIEVRKGHLSNTFVVSVLKDNEPEGASLVPHDEALPLARAVLNAAGVDALILVGLGPLPKVKREGTSLTAGPVMYFDTTSDDTIRAQTAGRIAILAEREAERARPKHSHDKIAAMIGVLDPDARLPYSQVRARAVTALDTLANVPD